VDWLVEPYDIGLVLPYAMQKIAVDSLDQWTCRESKSERRQNPRARLIGGKVKRDHVLAETLKGAKSIPGGLSGSRITDAENAALQRRVQYFSV
jgi:hypothetical protein